MNDAANKTVEIVEVTTDMGATKWIVKVNGAPVGNYWTRSAAERKAARA